MNLGFFKLSHLLYFILIIICTTVSSFIYSEIPSLLVLKGYLGKEEMTKAKKTIDELAKSQNKSLLIELSSSSGDINQVLEFAKTVYGLKSQNGLKVIVYIDDTAVGPAAIIPFLADEIYISLFVSWGDIPLGTENSIPNNILRNQVTSIIQTDNPHADILRLMAAAMSDKTLQVVDDNGWKITSDGKDTTHLVISTQGETLVVNQHQLQELHLVSGAMTEDKFLNKYNFTPAQKEEIKQETRAPATLVYSPKNIAEQLKDHIKYNANGPNHIGHILINDRQNGINQATWLYVKNALDHYKETKPIFVILELNTPGGEVYAAQEISDALKNLDTQYNIPVVCFINNWAISAGAMLAYSCRFITVVKDASMGAAEPVIMGEGTELKTASEKINSALRTDFANRARFYDRNPYIAEAMVDKDTILVLRHGEIIKLDTESQIRSSGPDPDIIISPKGKLLTLNADQLIKYDVADIMLMPEKTGEITSAEKETGKWPLSKMLLGQNSFFKEIPNATVDSYVMDWKTRFFAFLASPMISSLLVLGVMIGFYMELSSPGFGFPGTLALICLILIMLSSFALEIANWLEVILLVVGLAIIIIDLFVLPTFGLLGFVGVIFFLAGLLGMMLPGIGSVQYEFDTKTFNAAGEAFFERLAWLSGTLVLGLGIILLLARYITPTLAGYSRLVLSGHEQDASKGYIAGDNPAALPQPGSTGEVLATLRPAGKVLIADKIYDAISAGGFIEKGTPIEVVKLDGSVIVVNSVEAAEDRQDET